MSLPPDWFNLSTEELAAHVLREAVTRNSVIFTGTFDALWRETQSGGGKSVPERRAAERILAEAFFLLYRRGLLMPDPSQIYHGHFGYLIPTAQGRGAVQGEDGLALALGPI